MSWIGKRARHERLIDAGHLAPETEGEDVTAMLAEQNWLLERLISGQRSVRIGQPIPPGPRAGVRGRP